MRSHDLETALMIGKNLSVIGKNLAVDDYEGNPVAQISVTY